MGSSICGPNSNHRLEITAANSWQTRSSSDTQLMFSHANHVVQRRRIERERWGNARRVRILLESVEVWIEERRGLARTKGKFVAI